MQTCSIETNCDAGSLMAATLANGGICPLTGQKVIKREGNSIIIIIIISNHIPVFAVSEQVKQNRVDARFICLLYTSPSPRDA